LIRSDFHKIPLASHFTTKSVSIYGCTVNPFIRPIEMINQGKEEDPLKRGLVENTKPKGQAETILRIIIRQMIVFDALLANAIRGR